MTRKLTTCRPPGNSLARPYNRHDALADLRALGRQLDWQVTQRTGTTVAELDATLAAMQAVHDRVIAELTGVAPARLGRSLAAVAFRRSASRREALAA